MTKGEIFELLSTNPVFFLATLEENQPRVRGMLLYRADETGIIFHTGVMKDLYAQITKNPKAELCFNNLQKGIQVRVSGELEVLDNNVLKDEICEHPTRKFLKDMREKGLLDDFYKSCIVFRVKSAKAVVWTMETNFTPKEEISLYE